MPRPFRTPLNIRFRGGSLPVLSVIGGLGTFTVWCVVVATHAEGRLIGFTWMGIGITLYVIYRKAKGYSLTRTVEKVVVPETMQADIDYDQILVPIVGTRITDEMMVLACQLATEKKSSIDGLYVIEVPLNLPLDARLVNERAEGRQGAQGGGGDRQPVQGQVHAPRRHGAPGRACHRRRGHRGGAAKSSSWGRRASGASPTPCSGAPPTTCSTTLPARSS